MDRFVSAFIEDKIRLNIDLPDLHRMNFFKKSSLKEQFLSYLGEQEKGFYDGHAIHQIDAISDGNLIPIPMNFYLKLECIDADFQHMMQILGIKMTTPKREHQLPQLVKDEVYSCFELTTENKIKRLYRYDSVYFDCVYSQGFKSQD